MFPESGDLEILGMWRFDLGFGDLEIWRFGDLLDYLLILGALNQQMIK
jgi:hypothetical protein